ncbi:hypothetical protein AX15_001540 [Amanita polypyramis BW_CC]|nr:hypothetical protein AX15_001540 [Amanita polypyramis BW_CC]
MSDSINLKVVQVAAILSSAFASGGILSLSFLTVPTLLLPERPPERPTTSSSSELPTPATPISHVVRQWSYVYDTGKTIYPSIAASSALAFSYLAYILRGRPDKFSKLYLTAAAVTLSIVPYTLGVMLPTNKRLEARAKHVGREGMKSAEISEEEKAKREKEDREVPGLMMKWAWLNAIRGIFPLMGAVIGATAALC